MLYTHHSHTDMQPPLPDAGVSYYRIASSLAVSTVQTEEKKK